jgi:hypothetical protein
MASNPQLRREIPLDLGSQPWVVGFTYEDLIVA